MSRHQISAVLGRRVWDSRGNPTVEAEVHLASGAHGRAIAPAGASTGSGEAVDLRDGGTAFGGKGVNKAVANINGEIGHGLRGTNAADQAAVDGVLIELDGTRDKSRLGANATIAVSMAVAHAAAADQGLALWQYLLKDQPPVLPLPEIQIFGGGAHAGRRVDVQDFMVVCPGAGSFAQALEWTADVYRQAGLLMEEKGQLGGVADEGGFWPNFSTNEAALETLVQAIERAGYRAGEEVAISLDVAASEFRTGSTYRLGVDNRSLTSAEMIELLVGWAARYPIVSIEDPLAEDDEDGLVAITAALGHRTQIVGDDYLVTSAERVRRAAEIGACNALLVKPNQVGTLTETRDAFEAAQQAGWTSILSARSGETEDTTIVHLAVGWGVRQLKVGSFARSERMAKWNEALRIEEKLAGRAGFANSVLSPEMATTGRRAQ
ncbi:MAG: phosphopyruvate hydratase [Alphaproteobacteria bacterium]|nr:phosphopyruvate hydratase [Alphaproteobacteria bacterium]